MKLFLGVYKCKANVAHDGSMLVLSHIITIVIQHILEELVHLVA